MKAYVKMTLRSLPGIERDVETEMEWLGHWKISVCYIAVTQKPSPVCCALIQSQSRDRQEHDRWSDILAFGFFWQPTSILLPGKYKHTHIHTNKIIGQETYGWSVRFLYWKHFLLAQSFVSSKLGKNIFSREMTFRWPFKISCFLKFLVISRFSRTEGALKRVLGYGRYDLNLITQNFQYISW